MGWSFEICERSRKDYLERITGPGHFGPGYTPLESRVVGNHVWQLVRIEAANRTFITLDLIAKERNGGWGYKGMSEDMGPYYYDCPLALLDKASEPINESAKEWRIKVREFHAKKACKKALIQSGAVVAYGGIAYKLIRPAGPRKGWVVEHPNGCQLRMNSKQLSMAAI